MGFQVEFSKMGNGGYNPAEVDAYINKISQHYTQLHTAHSGQQEQIKRLTQEAQLSKDENTRLTIEMEKLQNAASYQMPIDTNTIAKLMLDAELFAKQIKDRSIADAERRLAEIQAQVRTLEIQKQGILDSIKQMAEDLTALTGGQYENTFNGGNQSGVYSRPGGQQSVFTADSAGAPDSPVIGDFFTQNKTNLG